MSVPALRLEGVGKTYGRHRALVDVTTTLPAARVTAILGPNGAGKSTLLGVLSTMLGPSKGRVLWGDTPLDRGSPMRARIGYVGHEPGLYGELGAWDNLVFFGKLHGVREASSRIEALLERVGLGHVRRDAPARTFSRGMQQRLALARALLHEPDLLLFDEPSSALDPAGVAWLGAELAAERRAGRIVVLVTHDLDAAAEVADHVLVIHRGRLVHDGPAPQGTKSLGELYRETTAR